MSKRYTPQEDRFIHAYHRVADIGPNDLGRTTASVNRRAKFLKESGAWDALSRAMEAERDYYRAIGLSEEDVDMAMIVR